MLGTDWTIEIEPGDITRRIMWQSKEVALVNPRGDFTDDTEKDLAIGIAHAAKMHMFLRGLSAVKLPPQKQDEFDALMRSIETMDAKRMIESADDYEPDEGGD